MMKFYVVLFAVYFLFRVDDLMLHVDDTPDPPNQNLGCNKDGQGTCDSPPLPGVPCVDQDCYEELNGDYSCEGANGGLIGYYDIASTFPKTEEGQPGEGKVGITTKEYACWIQKGCNISAGCDKVTDDVDPQVTHYRCAVDPSGSGTPSGKKQGSTTTGETCPVPPSDPKPPVDPKSTPVVDAPKESGRVFS